MISKPLIFTTICLVVFLPYSDSIRRRGYHSYSSSNFSNKSPPNPGRSILGISFMILSCGGEIGWKIYKCYQKQKRRKFLQSPPTYPNNIYISTILTSIIDQSNQNDLSSNRSTLAPLSVQSLEYTSQQTTTTEKKCSIIIPVEDVHIPSSTGFIATLL